MSTVDSRINTFSDKYYISETDDFSEERSNEHKEKRSHSESHKSGKHKSGKHRSRKHRGKNGGTIALIIVLVIILMYIGFSFYFVNHFYFNTRVDGVDASLKDITEVKRSIENQDSNYFLRIETVTGSYETLNQSDAGIKVSVSSKELLDEVSSQVPLLWIKGLFVKSNLNIEKDVSTDDAVLKNKIATLNCVTRTPEKSTADAHVALVGNKYEIVKEVYGEDIDSEVLFEKVKEALIAQKKELNLSDAGVYKQPEVLSTDESLINTCNALNNILKSDITYTFGSRTEHLGADTLIKWVSQDENGNPVIDDSAVTKYIADLASKYDTAGKAKTITRTMTGQPATVTAGTYGWKIDQEAEKTKLLEDIGKGTTIKRDPEYAQKAASRDGNDYGNTYIEVDITFQVITGYVNGQKVFSGPMVSGSVMENSETVLGAFAIYSKQRDRWLNGPTWHDWVFYWMPFYRDYGIHDATWRDEFGGDIYYANGSHGCVNLPQETAATIYNTYGIGTPVLVYK